MKKTAILVLATTISIAITTVVDRVNSAPKKEVDWNKLEPTMRNLLVNMETPNVLMGNVLTDGANNKSDCYEHTGTINSQQKLVATWACWGKRENSFPKITTKWSETIPELNQFAKNIMPPSRGNTLVDSKNRQHDCHLNSHVINNEGKPVAQWTCWSMLPFK
jgi:hypothetical protein